MPDRTILEKCCNLARALKARILTSVFQSDTVDEGVCRAMASNWIQTGLRSSQDSGGWARFRARADTAETGKVDSYYVQLQNTQVNTFDLATGLSEETAKATQLSEQMREELKMSELEQSERERYVRRANRCLNEIEKIQMGGANTRLHPAAGLLFGVDPDRRARAKLAITFKHEAGRLKREEEKMAEVTEAREQILIDKLQAQNRVVRRAARRMTALTCSNGETDALHLFVDPSEQNFGVDKQDFCRTRLKLDGYYYLGLKGHGVALYHHTKGECRFFDANTGEWAFRNAGSLARFFPEYFASIYPKGGFDNDTYRVYGYTATAPPAEYKSTKGCPFPACPFSGILTFACKYDV